MQHYIRTVTEEKETEKDIFYLTTNSDAWKISHPHEKIGTFQFSSSVHFPPPRLMPVNRSLLLFFPQHPKSCQNTLHEHDITFQVLTVITEKKEYKKSHRFFFKLRSINSYAFALFKSPQQIQLFLPRDSSFECCFPPPIIKNVAPICSFTLKGIPEVHDWNFLCSVNGTTIVVAMKITLTANKLTKS